MDTTTTTAKPRQRFARPAPRDYELLRELNGAPDYAVLTPKEVAALSGFGEAALRQWSRQGSDKGPPRFVVAGRPRYWLKDVRAWLNAAPTTAAIA